MPNRGPLGNGPLALFENLRNGTFRPTPLSQGDFDEFGSCAAGDIDNDGLVDVAAATPSAFRIILFRNGGGSFSQVEVLSIPATGNQGDLQSGFGAIAFADFDGDGMLDLVAAPFLQFPSIAPTCGPTSDGFSCLLPSSRCMPPPVVFRNLGGGTFGPGQSAVDPSTCGPANVYAVAITDYNGDGRPDFFLANDFGVDALYVQGETPMTFADVAPTLGLKGYNHAMGAAFADYDLDGKMDLYVADLGSDQFYLGADGGILARRGADWGVAVSTRFHSGWAPLAEDFDSDGFPDVWVGNSALVGTYDDLRSVGEAANISPRPQSDFFFHNDEGRNFELIQVPQTDEVQPQVAAGASATADFDGDGRPDIVESLGYPMRTQLLHNIGAGGHWLDLRLVGHRSNRDALGARVTLRRSGHADVTKWVERARGSIGVSSSTVHFGLGSRTDVDAIAIRWPSGVTQTLSRIPDVDRVLQVDENAQ
jgi:hypothetical protein